MAAERLADAEARVTVADSRASAAEARAAQAEADRASTLERLLAGAIDAQAHSNASQDGAVHEPDGIGLRPVAATD